MKGIIYFLEFNFFSHHCPPVLVFQGAEWYSSVLLILSTLFSLFTDAFYDIVTVGAPAAHFQGFKCSGLQRLLSRYEAEKKR